MLRLSKMADYGTVVMTTLIREPERNRSAVEIASAIHVPAWEPPWSIDSMTDEVKLELGLL